MNSLDFTAELNGIYRTTISLDGKPHILRISMSAINKLNASTQSNMLSILTHPEVTKALQRLQTEKHYTDSADVLRIEDGEADLLIGAFNGVVAQ